MRQYGNYCIRHLLNIRKGVQKIIGLVLLFCTGLSSDCRAHVALYQNVELNLREPQRASLLILVHVPELTGEVDAGSAGARWLEEKSDAELGRFIEEARRWLPTQMSLTMGGDPVDSGAFSVPALDAMREAARTEQVPPGCFLATLELPLPPGAVTLKITYAAGAPKRLLFIVSRPKAFPEPHDLGPGESRDLLLPPGPPRPSSRAWWLSLGGMALLAAGYLLRRGRREPGAIQEQGTNRTSSPG